MPAPPSWRNKSNKKRWREYNRFALISYIFILTGNIRDNKIYRGVLTGFNEAFVIDNAKKQALTGQDPRSAEIIKPILRGRDIERYRANWAEKWLIATFPSLRLNIDDYPAVKSHLLSFGINRLEQSGKKHPNNVKARKKTPHAWYELQDTCAYHALFDKENIAWQRITQEPRFCKTTAGMLILDSMAFFNGKDLSYVAAILNSKLIAKYVDMVVHQYGDTGYRLSNQYVEAMPVPIGKDKNERLAKEITNAANSVFAGKERGENTSDLENRIDSLVYTIYGLDDSEIGIVEDFARSRSKNSRSLAESL